MSSSATHRDRLALGAGALLTLNEAARLLPMSSGDARLWLRDSRLVVDLDGRPVVVWGDVLNHLRTLHEDTPRRVVPTLRRVSLDPR